ncbi:MAG TPA: 4Fe-4S dicluster domain-containing protein [Denitromonas sp.]|uniref:4Fe-4S dicluster domain-containing protein n=1 Tax=Denitromonas sp. TaxID=2734609 RepID=UPI002BC5E9C0|nr:4Fe-4S dicluster domain-containing protein [Denitromonas sp.]
MPPRRSHAQFNLPLRRRAELDGLRECILCGCCSGFCPSYWWNPDKFLGPATLPRAYRFVADSRDTATQERLVQLDDVCRRYRCRSIMNCTEVCPMHLSPSRAVEHLRIKVLKDAMQPLTFNRDTIMAIEHAAPGDLLNILPPRSEHASDASSLLVRADHLEVFRLALPAGKRTPSHAAAGTITIQCLSGRVELETSTRTQIMTPGTLVYLADAEPHAVCALDDAVLLITILLHRS